MSPSLNFPFFVLKSDVKVKKQEVKVSQAIEHYKPIIIDDKVRSGFQPIRLLLTSSVQITHTLTHTPTLYLHYS